MLNTKYFHIRPKLYSHFQEAFSSDSEFDKFLFLRIYIKYVESDNECYNKYFELSDPLLKYDECQQMLEEVNKQVADFLEGTLESMQTTRRRQTTEGEITCYLGAAYEYGLFNKPRNFDLAYYYYTISAQLHNDFGTFRLALCYEKGIGTEIDIDKAIYFFRCSAKLGLVDSMHVYGTILANGYYGCEKNIELGLHYMSLASLKANKIYPHPLYDIARWYENKSNSNEVIADQDYSFDVYLRGARLRDPNCMYRLAKAYEVGDFGRNVDIEKAFTHYSLAAERGQLDAQLAVSEIFFSGVGTGGKRSAEESFFWALCAATKGSGRAAYITGEYAMKGFGIKGDILLGLWWFMIASAHGYDGADERVVKLQQEVDRINEGPYVQQGWCTFLC